MTESSRRQIKSRGGRQGSKKALGKLPISSDARSDAQGAAVGDAAALVPAEMRQALLRWFDGHRRDLPWRRTKDPYRIWISEVMLQQTQVVTVIDYYLRFIERFPDPTSLASADESEVLRYWEGLGYYRRARSLHQAARVIVERHGGVFPTIFDEVKALPGIGRYTAGAILSIALDHPLPILEGNTIRVHARLYAIEGCVTTKPVQDRLWGIAERMVVGERPGDLNQGLMELGSEICTPKSPRCLLCPISQWCAAVRSANPERWPVKLKRMEYEDREEAIALVRRRGKTLVRRCGKQERWAGLWDFPRFGLEGNAATAKKSSEPLSAEWLATRMREATGLEVSLRKTPWQHRHAVTRFRIQLACWWADEVTGRLAVRTTDRSQGIDWRWVDDGELSSLPLSVTGRAVARALDELQRQMSRDD